MRCIGNDIVDLGLTGTFSDDHYGRFLHRVLTDEEQAALISFSQPERFLWAFWAAKESAYKSVFRYLTRISSSPKNYHVSFLPCADSSVLCGTVVTPAFPVQVQAIIQNDYIHCLGISGACADFRRVEIGVCRMVPEDGSDVIRPDQESRMVREAAKNRIAQLTGSRVSRIDIRRKEASGRKGPPEVFIAGKKTDIIISLSHDGRFGAFALSGITERPEPDPFPSGLPFDN